MTRSSIPGGSALPSSGPSNDDCRPFDRLRRRALNGPDQEVYFPQEHPPGREAQFDFTHGSALGVTVAGQPYHHLLFQLILPLGLALRRDRRRRDFPGHQAGTAECALDPGRRTGGGEVRQYLRRHPRIEGQPRPGA